MTLRALLFTAALAVAGSASAQPAGGPPDTPEMRAVMTACAADMKSLCGDKKPGMEVGQCMDANKAKASPDCQAAMSKLPPMPAH